MSLIKGLAAAVLAATWFHAVAAGPVQADDVVRIASPYPTTTLDPMRSAAGGNIETFGQLYSRLLRRDESGEVAPGLAESWEVSPDGLTVTATLRDAKFSDGSPITAADVVFSLERVRTNAESAYPAPLQQIESVTADGDRTVVIKLKSALAPILGNLEVFNAAIVSKADVEARGEEAAFTDNPLTSGPYMVKEWRPNDRLVLAPNPHYWRDGYPKNGGAELIEVPSEETRVAMLRAGEVDAVRDVPWAQIADLKADDTLDVPLEKSTVIYMTLLNHARAPFSDLKLRQAAAHAIDTAGFTQAVTHGNAVPANTTIPNALVYHHESFPGLAYDTAKAQSLLGEGGAPEGELVILVTATPQNEQMALLLQAQWAAVGLKSKIEKVDSGTWWDRVVKGDYDAAPSWWYNETPDPDLAVRWALCGSCGNNSFYTNYSNAKVDELVDKGAQELDSDKRRSIYYEIQEITTTEVSQIPLFYPPFANAYSKRIEGLRMTPSLQWTLEEVTVVQ